MKVELLHGTERPEEEVCRAARNDYRSDGVLPSEHGYGEVMWPIEPSEKHLSDGDEVVKGSKGWTEAQEKTLIDHLMRSDHWGPFEHPQAAVAIKGVTRVLMAQMTRHRHMSFDVMSLRYVSLDGIDTDDREDLEETFHFPDVEEEIITRDGVSDDINVEYVNKDFKAAYSSAAHYYTNLLDRGVPQEIARKVLPMGTKVNIVASGNARAWMHILLVRRKADVQGETRECADMILDIMQDWMPYTFERYEEMSKSMRVSP